MIVEICIGITVILVFAMVVSASIVSSRIDQSQEEYYDETNGS